MKVFLIKLFGSDIKDVLKEKELEVLKLIGGWRIFFLLDMVFIIVVGIFVEFFFGIMKGVDIVEMNNNVGVVNSIELFLFCFGGEFELDLLFIIGIRVLGNFCLLGGRDCF